MCSHNILARNCIINVSLLSHQTFFLYMYSLFHFVFTYLKPEKSLILQHRPFSSLRLKETPTPSGINMVKKSVNSRLYTHASKIKKTNTLGTQLMCRKFYLKVLFSGKKFTTINVFGWCIRITEKKTL